MAGRVEGLGSVLSNLNAKVNEVERKSEAGLYKAGLLVQRTAQQRTPRDTGNLRASAYTRKIRAIGPRVEVGFTAAYAPFVHENMEQTLKGQPRRGGSGKGVYWETGQPKFLESALHDNERNILRLIRGEAMEATR